MSQPIGIRQPIRQGNVEILQPSKGISTERENRIRENNTEIPKIKKQGRRRS